MCVCVCVCVCVRMYKCECAQVHVGGEGPGRGDRSQAGPEAGAGQLAAAATNLKMEARRAKNNNSRARGGELWPMTRRVAGCRRQQNKQMEPGRPLQIPTVAPSKDPILGPVGHELGFPNMPKLAPSSTYQPPFYQGQVAAALRGAAQLPSYARAQPCLRSSPSSQAYYLGQSLLDMAKCYRDIHLSINLGTLRKVESSILM